MKRITLILSLLLLLTVFTACSNKSNPQKADDIISNPPVDTDIYDEEVNGDVDEPQESPEEPEAQEPADEPDEPTTIPEPLGNMNPLTGLYDGISDEALNTRPVAIMIGNTSDSLPQWGVSQADIIYEMIAEARSTRLMAIFQDHTKIDKIASIRSARPYFIDIAQSYGAVFIHFGGSEPAYEQISLRSDLIHIDGIKYPWEGTVFFRDEWRKSQLGREHSVYTTGEHLTLGFNKLKTDLSQTEHPSAFNFGEDHSAINGTSMTRVQIRFKDKHQPYFEYDALSGKFLRYQYNSPQMDGITNTQIAVKNLFILRMELTDIKESDLGIIDVKTTGKGTGYYFCDGNYIEIIWKKESYNSEINYYTTDGQELICAPGQSFISVVSIESKVTIE